MNMTTTINKLAGITKTDGGEKAEQTTGRIASIPVSLFHKAAADAAEVASAAALKPLTADEVGLVAGGLPLAMITMGMISWDSLR
jgi:hypothetical protein